MNSPTVLVKICPECKESFQTYDYSKDFCSIGCKEKFQRVRYQKFLADRKSAREIKNLSNLPVGDLV